MKTFKRNAVIITVVLFVCVAAYLNWSYNQEDDPAANPVMEVTGSAPAPVTAGPAGAEGPPEGDGLFYQPGGDSGEAGGTSADFFAAARLGRQQARDASVQTLSTVSQTDGASQEVVDEALAKISKIAAFSQKEAELESVIMAKGFEDCVVFISDEGVKVTVPAPVEGLSQVSVAQITDVITTETEYAAADLNIIEVK